VIRLERFLYFRGWFLLVVLGIGIYSYLRGWYTAIVFSAFLLLGLVNLLFDLFTVYPEKLANPTPTFTVLMALRLLAVWCVYLTVRNASRLPDVKDRANILLPFRAKDPL
jgi:integral membrane sensor domain MASE1